MSTSGFFNSPKATNTLNNLYVTAPGISRVIPAAALSYPPATCNADGSALFKKYPPGLYFLRMEAVLRLDIDPSTGGSVDAVQLFLVAEESGDVLAATPSSCGNYPGNFDDPSITINHTQVLDLPLGFNNDIGMLLVVDNNTVPVSQLTGPIVLTPATTVDSTTKFTLDVLTLYK